MAARELDVVSWEDLDALVDELAGMVGDDYDVMMAISRGGLVPAGMLAYRLGLRHVLVASAVAYHDGSQTGGPPVLLEFPEPVRLEGRRILLVDEVWESGRTIAAVVDLVLAAGGLPTTAVLHYKPSRSLVPIVPDHHVVSTDAWVNYPFKAGR